MLGTGILKFRYGYLVNLGIFIGQLTPDDMQMALVYPNRSLNGTLFEDIIFSILASVK